MLLYKKKLLLLTFGTTLVLQSTPNKANMSFAEQEFILQLYFSSKVSEEQLSPSGPKILIF